MMGRGWWIACWVILVVAVVTAASGFWLALGPGQDDSNYVLLGCVVIGVNLWNVGRLVWLMVDDWNGR